MLLWLVVVVLTLLRTWTPAAVSCARRRGASRRHGGAGVAAAELVAREVSRLQLEAHLSQVLVGCHAARRPRPGSLTRARERFEPHYNHVPPFCGDDR